MKICILGNSVGFKIRPPRSGPEDLTYAEILERHGHVVRNMSRAGVMLSEQFALLDDDVLTLQPDAVILHQGIIEVFHRRTVRRWNNAAIVNQYRNGLLRQAWQADTVVHQARRFAWRAVNALTRATARAFGWRWQWQRTERFLAVVASTCDLIRKETAARIIVVGITPPSAAAELDLPGLRATIAAANHSLAEYCARDPARLAFLDTAELPGGGDAAGFAPDGIHFSAAGHRLVGSALLRMLGTKPIA